MTSKNSSTSKPAMRQALSKKDIATACGVHPSTILRWVKEGKLPLPFKPTERCTRWWADEVVAALEAMRAA